MIVKTIHFKGKEYAKTTITYCDSLQYNIIEYNEIFNENMLRIFLYKNDKSQSGFDVCVFAPAKIYIMEAGKTVDTIDVYEYEKPNESS